MLGWGGVLFVSGTRVGWGLFELKCDAADGGYNCQW